MSYWLLFALLFLMSIAFVWRDVVDSKLRMIRDGTGPHNVSLLPPLITAPLFLAAAAGIDYFWPGWGAIVVLVVSGAMTAHSLFVTSEMQREMRDLMAKRSDPT